MKRRRREARAWTSGKIVLTILGTVAFVVGAAFTAANVVPSTGAADEAHPVDRNQLAPSECDQLNLTTTVSGSGVISGTLDNDWIVGSDGIDTVDGLAGDDCIEGKGGDDVIDGSLGNDVCIGGGGTDTFVGCETEYQ